MLCAPDDVVCGFAFAFEQQVCLADGVGFGVDLLTVEVSGYLLSVILCELLERFLGHGQHAARTTSAVIDKVGAVGELVGDGQEDKAGHELYRIARGPVLARLLVILLIEPAYKLLEDRAHGVVVEAGKAHGSVAVSSRLRAQVDARVKQFLDQRADPVGLGEPRNLVVKLEVVEDLLDIGREAVQVSAEVSLELLAASPVPEVAQRKLRGVIECLPRRLSQRLILMDNASLVECGPKVEHGLLGRLEHRVEPADHRHREDHVAVLAAHV